MGKKNMKQPGNNQKGSPDKSPQKGVAAKSKAIAKKSAPGKGKAAEKPGRFQKPTENKKLTNGVAKLQADNKKSKPNQNQKGGKQQQQKGKLQQQKAKAVIVKNEKPQGKKGKAVVDNVEKPQGKKGKAVVVKDEKPQPAKSANPKQKDNKLKIKKELIGKLKMNKNKNQSPQTKPKTETQLPEAAATNEVIKLNKRNKNRLKSEMKKEIILKGKNPVKLQDIKLLEKKLAKLVAKAPPHSNKVQRKILLIESLIVNAKNANKKAHKTVKSEPEVKPVKVKKETSVINGDTDNKHPKNEFVVFVGHLPPDITKETLQEHFKSAGEVQKIRIPKPKRKKTKFFAYLQFADKEAKEKALDMHGTKIGERVINVMYADKKGGKKTLNSENGKLATQRKAAANITEKQMIEVGKKLKNKKKKNSPKKLAKK